MNKPHLNNLLDHSQARCHGMAWVKLVLSLVGLVLIVGLGVAAVSGSGGGGESASAVRDSAEWYEVRRQSFDLTVIESGDMDAAQRLEIKSRVDGRPEIIYLIEEGKSVKEGEVLVRLADDAVKQKIEQELLKVEQARADEVYARQDLAIERKEADALEAVARVELELAVLELAKWEKGDVPQARRGYNLDLQKAERLVERTDRDHELSKELYAQKFISLNDLEDSEIEELEAREGLASAALAKEVYEKYTFRTEQQTNQSAVDQANADLEKRTAQNESSLARLEAQLNSKVKTLAIREARLTELNEQLVASVIKAPLDGMVVYSTSVGRRSGDPMAEGRQVRFNETLIYLPNTEQMVANLAVAESYEPIVQLGQTVRVSVEARPGLIYEGVVDTISLISDTGGWLNPNQREFTVRVLLPKGIDPTLKPAMRCTGEIAVGRVEEKLAVPVQAVFAEGEEYYCYVPAGGSRVQKRIVEIGRASEALVVIESGLEEGDRVLLRDPRPGEATQGSSA